MGDSNRTGAKKSGEFLVIKNLFYGIPKRGESDSQRGIPDEQGERVCDPGESSEYDSEKYKLDLYAPKHAKVEKSNFNGIEENSANGDSKKSPVVVFVHGGGWRRGDRCVWKHYLSVCDTNLLVAAVLGMFKLYGNVGEALATRGIACAVISYPLSSLPLSWTLFEMFTSYVMSSIFLLTVGSVVSLLLYCSLWFIWPEFIQQVAVSKHMRLANFNNMTLCLTALTFVNVSYVVIMTALKRQYQMTWTRLLFLWAVMIFCISSSLSFPSPYTWVGRCSLYSFLTTFLATQGVLLFLKLDQRNHITYRDQLEAVNQVIDFVKYFGDKHKLYDPDRLYLMGYSAGGHLVTLLTLNNVLRKCASDTLITSPIKGVISISGVYDLPKLNKGLLKPLYLLPPFGVDPSHWTKASPTHVVQSLGKSVISPHHVIPIPPANHIPPFLLITASRDLHLQEDAESMCTNIENAGGICYRLTINKSNHFTIIWDFGCKSKSKSTSNLTDICVEFISS